MRLESTDLNQQLECDEDGACEDRSSTKYISETPDRKR